MPDFDVTSPDGRKFRWTGDHAPTAPDIMAFERQLGPPPAASAKPPATAPAAKPPAPTPGLLSRIGAAYTPMIERAKTQGERAIGGVKHLVTGEGGRSKAVSDVIEGGLGAAEVPALGVLAGTMVLNPLETVAAAAIGYGVQAATEYGAKRLGTSPQFARAAGDVAGLVAPGAKGTSEFLRTGIASTPEAAARLRTNERLGLKLSAPEIATGTKAGTAGKLLQQGVTSTVTGRTIQASQRAEGDHAATRALDQALATIAKPTTPVTAGRAAEAGIGAGQSGLRAIGAQLGAIAKQEPPVDIVPVMNDAWKMLVDDIAPRLADFPELSKGAREAIIRGRTSGHLIQVLGRPIQADILKAISTKSQTPVMKVVRIILDAGKAGGGDVQFDSAHAARSALMDYAGHGPIARRSPDEALAGRFASQLTDILSTASPAYKDASTRYRLAIEKVHHDATDKIFEVATSQPEAAINAVGLEDVTKAKLLRQTMTEVAPVAGTSEGQRGAQAFDAFRVGWFQRQVIEGRKAESGTSATGTGPDFAGLGQRLRTAEKSGVLKELMGDRAGQLLVHTAREIGDAYDARAPQVTRSMYIVFTAARVLMGGSPANFAKSEAATGLLTWLLYRPQVARQFVIGSQSPTGRGQAMLQRLGQAYGADLAARRRDGASRTPTGPPATSP